MLITAKLTVKVGSERAAESLARALGPDNLDMRGLSIESMTRRTGLIFDISFNGKIETFISTLDDLLRCLHAAKDSIEKIAR